MIRKLILLSASLFLAGPASASLIDFSLDQSSISTPQGGIPNGACQDGSLACLIFTGTISFTTDQDYFLYDIQVDLNPDNPDSGFDVVGNDNYFQDNNPGLLGPDGVQCGDDDSCYMGGLFEVDVPTEAPVGVYDGTATLVATDFDGDPITGSDTVLDFQVDVIAPEPGMGMLMFAGLASLAAMGRRLRAK